MEMSLRVGVRRLGGTAGVSVMVGSADSLYQTPAGSSRDVLWH